MKNKRSIKEIEKERDQLRQEIDDIVTEYLDDCFDDETELIEELKKRKEKYLQLWFEFSESI